MRCHFGPDNLAVRWHGPDTCPRGPPYSPSEQPRHVKPMNATEDHQLVMIPTA